MGDRGHNRHRPKRGGAAVPLLGIAGTPCNTMWPGPRSTSVPSRVFIHPAIWPATTDMGRKLGAVPLWGGGGGSPFTLVDRGHLTCFRFMFMPVRKLHKFLFGRRVVRLQTLYTAAVYGGTETYTRPPCP